MFFMRITKFLFTSASILSNIDADEWYLVFNALKLAENPSAGLPRHTHYVKFDNWQCRLRTKNIHDHNNMQNYCNYKTFEKT